MKIIFINLSSTWRGFEIAFMPSLRHCSLFHFFTHRRKVYDQQSVRNSSLPYDDNIEVKL